LKASLFLVTSLVIAVCTSPLLRADPIRDSFAFARGKPPSYVPIVTVHGFAYINTQLFRDLKGNFVGPLVSSEYRFVIDRITIDATGEEFAQWKVEVKLDTGARITLTGLNKFYNTKGASHFDAAFKQILTKLKAERKRDPMLRRYFLENGKRIGVPSGSRSFSEVGL
jgi:hypothetical protein